MTGTEQVINQLGALSYGGIWIVSFLSNIVIPFPEEITLLALGYLSGTGAVNGFIVVPIVISALLVNDIILYTLSKRGSRLTNFLYKKFFAKKLEKRGEEWLTTNIGNIIFFSRFLMQFRFVGPFVAGSQKVPRKKFITYDVSALIIYVPLYIGLGAYFHSRVVFIIDRIGVAKNVLLVLAGLLLAFLIARLVYRFIYKSIRA